MSSKIETEKPVSLPTAKNDSFETKHKVATTNPAPAKKQGIPIIATALIGVTSAVAGGTAVFLGAKQFNWFELGKKVETKTVKELPESLNNLLNSGGTPLTEEQAIKVVKTLQQDLEKAVQALTEAQNKENLQQHNPLVEQSRPNLTMPNTPQKKFQRLIYFNTLSFVQLKRLAETSETSIEAEDKTEALAELGLRSCLHSVGFVV